MAQPAPCRKVKPSGTPCGKKREIIFFVFGLFVFDLLFSEVGLYRDIPEGLRGMIEPVVEGAGFELVDVLFKRGRPPWQVKIVIDTLRGDGRVPNEHCAVVSREIETNFDAADAIESAYRLEVSSPGLDRILAREKDFEAALGSEIQLQTREPQDGRRKYRGLLLGFEGGVVHLKMVSGNPGVTQPMSRKDIQPSAFLPGSAAFRRISGHSWDTVGGVTKTWRGIEARVSEGRCRHEGRHALHPQNNLSHARARLHEAMGSGHFIEREHVADERADLVPLCELGEVVPDVSDSVDVRQ